MAKIPERQAIFDDFQGYLYQVEDDFLLASHPLDDLPLIQQGQLIIRYGITLLGKPHLSIVPALLALDYGQFLTGEDAWDFLLKRSNLYPRADVIGYRNDGQDGSLLVKHLDMAYPCDVLVYEQVNSTKPLANVRALIATDTTPIAARLLTYLNHYPTLADWQNSNE